MIETVVILVGLCVTFLPALMYFKYLMTHVSKKTRFDYHKELVNDKKGKLGVFVAYVERITFGVVICSFGILMSEFFNNEFVLKFFIITLIFYVIVKYVDEKFEK